MLEESPLTVVYDGDKDSKDIQLVLANNETIILADDADILYDKQDGIVVNATERIKASKAGIVESVLNKLIVPKGKRSSLTLADGTKVWVNSGSTLQFPSVFDINKREIWVEGEIYIEVEKDVARPFYVNTSRMQIDVTGTRFNVMAYYEDIVQSVVLVEGGVNVNIENEKVSLSPDYILSITGENISTKKINVNDYISWKDGLLQFSDEPLSNILTRLSRYYDIPIVCDDNVKDLKCYGKLVLFEDIESVLKTIYNTIPVTYTVNDNLITIRKK